jgi:hypothetical protein
MGKNCLQNPFTGLRDAGISFAGAEESLPQLSQTVASLYGFSDSGFPQNLQIIITRPL